MEQKLHTPEGVRDIYNKECEIKLTLQKKLSTVLHSYGYQDIQTPTFEYFDVFRKEIGSTSAREMYKFFDREGNILALRPDITPSIARAVATLFETEDFPIRLCYAGNTFINHSSYQGRLKENTQLGAELIGVDSIEADAEMLAMVVDGLKKTGLKEFQVSIGHVDFIQSLFLAAGQRSVRRGFFLVCHGGDVVEFLVFDLKPPCHGTVDHCLQLGTDGVEVYRTCQHNDIGIDHLLQDFCHIILVDAGSAVGAAVVAAGTGSHLFLSDPDLFCFVPGILRSTQKFIA